MSDYIITTEPAKRNISGMRTLILPTDIDKRLADLAKSQSQRGMRVAKFRVIEQALDALEGRKEG